jgi:tripartite-type tricarboxylate transporter receptor subunit TctC
MTGRIDFQFATMGPTLENIREGKLRVLATTGARRATALPDVPTMSEAGLKDYEIVLWLALATPTGTPDSIIDRLNRDLAAVMSEPETKQLLQQQGFDAAASSPETVTSRISAETASWKALADKGVIQLQ